MIYAYLFEAKSIQHYLFNSGKLKDVISASERLDRLVDDSPTSVLSRVLTTANLSSDLHEQETELNRDGIYFLRCKGGAFYAYCHQETPLQQLRSIWTLTLGQLFPSLVVTDALVSGDSLQTALDEGHAQLAADRNAPQVSFPIAPAIAERYNRTGNAAVPLSKLAISATQENDAQDSSLDIETEKHRQAYQSFGLRDNAALQDRFTPDDLKGEVYYPINFEKEFEFEGDKSALERSQRDAIKDMALIHIDGNGLGLLLMALKEALPKNEADYRKGFRQFSTALNKSTVAAAQIATQELYEQVESEGVTRDKQGRMTLPMRPVVLGGDDITLFCRADLALQYSRTFCEHFKKASELALEELFDAYLSNSKLLPFITASGGILYHKANHPFMHSHHLVEALCDKAKALTKRIYAEDKTQKVGPAALALYRVSNATQLGLGDITKQSLTHSINENTSLTMGLQSYFVSNEKCETENGQHSTNSRSFHIMDELVELSNSKNAPVSMAKWRQMATHIALGDMEEARRIYHRSVEQCNDKAKIQKLTDALSTLKPTDDLNELESPWYWFTTNDSSKQMATMINDLLIVDHYMSGKKVAIQGGEE